MSKKLPISAIKAALQKDTPLVTAKEKYKSQFTPGFYHGSPSSNIKSFDPSKTTKDKDFITPDVTFATKDPDFAESFLPMVNPKQYKTGATMYPISVNMGKHFDANTPEGMALIRRYAGDTPVGQRLMESSWTEMESPVFLDFLKKQGYDTFKVQEGGIDNIGIFKPENIRGKFAKYNPEDAESPDFMKAEGGLIHLAGAGSVAKAIKNLPKFGQKVNFVHYSKSPNVNRLEPNMYGTGIKGAEASRLADMPDIKPRSYFYVDTPNVKPEVGLGSNKYKGSAENVYPLHTDPEELAKTAKQMSMDDYLASQGIQQVDRNKYLNNLERMIKEKGYSGYLSDDAGVLFYPTDVLKSID
jgi:hypothetical protein